MAVNNNETFRARYIREKRCITCLVQDEEGQLVDRGRGPVWYCREHLIEPIDGEVIEMRFMLLDWTPLELARMGIV